jgi:hypothetical protein
MCCSNRSIACRVVLIALAYGPVALVAGEREEAELLVQQAVRAAADGDTRQVRVAVKRALAIDDDCPLARYYDGQIRSGDRWVTLEQAQQQAKNDAALAEYFRLRNRGGDNLATHLALARHCRTHGMAERERWHWNIVSRFQPQNAEAKAGLKRLAEQQGNRREQEQVQQEHQQRIAAWRARRDQWRRTVEQLRRDLASDDPATRQRAVAQMRAIDDPVAVQCLEPLLDGECELAAREAVEVLGRFNTPISTGRLANLAVVAPWENVRTAATELLAKRSWYDFVPQLLATMTAPIETSYSAVPMGNGFIASITLFREGPLADQQQHLSVRVKQRGPIPDLAPPVAQAAARTAATAANVEKTAQWLNSQADVFNRRIDAVLTAVTGQKLNGQPQAWWKWWKEHNELYDSTDKPTFTSYGFANYVYETQLPEGYSTGFANTNSTDIHKNSGGQYAIPTDTGKYRIVLRALSCFLAGTPVWTETGPVPIEKLQVGDRVLTQGIRSGVLSYQFVLQTTVRPETPSVRIGVEGDADEIYATRGHPFWVVGKGWRMAKELETGWRLHTPSGPRAITHVGQGPSAVAHNLVVAGASNYFVGNLGVLVHDNMIRGSEPMAAPGVPLEQ